MGKASPFFLLLLAFGFFVSTYNLITLVIHSQNNDEAGELVDILGFLRQFDPPIRMPNDLKESDGERRPFHVALTATDAPYSKWQCRIMYYWYKKMKDVKGSELGDFTRVLHSGSPDDLVNEIPTFVVDPLPGGMDRDYENFEVYVRQAYAGDSPKAAGGLLLITTKDKEVNIAHHVSLLDDEVFEYNAVVAEA